MNQSVNVILDRRRLRRKLVFWRIAALVIAAIVALYFVYLGNNIFDKRNGAHIAKIRIENTIFENEDLLNRLDKIATNDAVKAVILAINSPGGTTVGGEVIFNAVRKIAAQKPVVAQVGTLAASAGYMIACASDHIVAHQSSIIGSIGVLFQYPDISQLLAKIGVKVETIKSSPLKAEPNFFNPASEEAKTMIHKMIMDSYDWFVDLVEKRRSLSHAETLALANGSVFTGKQALEKKLVDELGSQEEAVNWLKSKGIVSNLTVIEWKPATTNINLLFSESAMKFIEWLLGFPEGRSHLLREIIARNHIFLDGLLSVWHVDATASRIQ